MCLPKERGGVPEDGGSKENSSPVKITALSMQIRTTEDEDLRGGEGGDFQLHFTQLPSSIEI